MSLLEAVFAAPCGSAGFSLSLPVCGLAFTRYSITLNLSCTSRSSVYCSLHLYCSHYCNAIVWLMRNIRPPPDSLVYAIHHTILAVAISCEGQCVALWGSLIDWSIHKTLHFCRLPCQENPRLGIGLVARVNPREASPCPCVALWGSLIDWLIDCCSSHPSFFGRCGPSGSTRPADLLLAKRWQYVKQSTTHANRTHRENTPDTGKPLTRTQSEKRHNDA